MKPKLTTETGFLGGRYVPVGVLVSVAWVVVITMLEASRSAIGFDPINLLTLHWSSPLFWLIDLTAIGITYGFYFTGKRLDEALEKDRQATLRYKQMAELREMADHANRTKSQFLANMSHEIRTPMNAIIGMSYLMNRSGLDARQKDYLQKIDLSARNLLQIINDILDFSKIEAGKLTLETANIFLEELVAEVAAMVNVKLQKKSMVELVTWLDPEIPGLILGDPVRLRQVLLNLTDNAAKFTSEGEIKLSAKVVQKMNYGIVINFSVQDTGVGIPADVLSRIFSPFHQADLSTTRKFGGTGLGLAISKNIVEMMDGELQVASEVGKGTEFSFNAYFSLPGEQTNGSQAPFRLSGLRALLVDDSESARMVLREILDSFGFEVVEASDAFQAREIFADAHQSGSTFSLLVVDWQMPGMDGLELIDQLGRNYRSVPAVLMVTAYGQETIQAAVQEKKIDAMLLKPVNPSILFETINKILNLGRQIKDQVAELVEDSGNFRAALAGKRVLLVEDNEINLELGIELLQDVGIAVETARDGQQAIECLRRSIPDVVLMDIQMPEMDGLTATRVIRSELKLRDLPILAMTAHAMKGEREKSISAGMNEHIHKPIDPIHLYKMLVRYAGTDTAAAVPIDAPQPAQEQANFSIEGVDVKSGLRRSAGKQKVYLKLLRTFVVNYGNFNSRVELLIQQDRFEEAGILLHTLAGVAGNIGVGEVYTLAHRLSTEFKDHIRNGYHTFREIHQHKLREVATVLMTYLDRIQAFLQEADPHEASGIRVEGEKLGKLIADLRSLIEDNDPASTDKCQMILDVGALSDVDKERLNSVLLSLNNFDFEEALKKLDRNN